MDLGQADWRRVAAALLLAALVTACARSEETWDRAVREGNRSFEAEDYRGAEAAYTRALALRAGEPGILVNRGNAKMMLGNAEGARADYDAALRRDPDFAPAYANRGILRDRNGDPAGAIADYRRALELDPSLAEGPGILDRILYNRAPTTLEDRLEYLEATQRPN